MTEHVEVDRFIETAAWASEMLRKLDARWRGDEHDRATVRTIAEALDVRSNPRLRPYEDLEQKESTS